MEIRFSCIKALNCKLITLQMIYGLNPSQIPGLNKIPPLDWDFDYESFLRSYLPTDFFKAFILLQDKEIVGTGNVFYKGKIGWLANIIIIKAYRQQGLGAKMTQHLVDYLDKQGCETQLLIATELGESVYEKIGFRKVSSYQGFYSAQNQVYKAGTPIKNIEKKDLQSICDMDLFANGECRKHLIERYYETGFGYFNMEHELLGYYLPDFGRGLVVAKNEKAGIELLKLKHSQKGKKTMLPIENKAGIECLTQLDIPKTDRWSRMSLGKSLSWNPKLIYSYASGYCG